MNKEIEAKFLHQDVELVREKLKKADATLIYSMRDTRRVNLDFPDYKLDKKRAWLRVREDGEQVKLTYKQKVAKDVDIHGVTEIETEVGDYEQIVHILEASGMIQKSVQQTKRELWQLQNCEIMIDQWPWIDPFVEIEGKAEDDVKIVAKLLGYNWSQATFGDVGPAYFDEYDISEDELYIKLTSFDFESAPPGWLQERRKK